MRVFSQTITTHRGSHSLSNQQTQNINSDAMRARREEKNKMKRKQCEHHRVWEKVCHRVLAQTWNRKTENQTQTWTWKAVKGKI